VENGLKTTRNIFPQTISAQRARWLSRFIQLAWEFLNRECNGVAGWTPAWGTWARISGQPQSAVERRCQKSHKGASLVERKSGQFAFGSWPVLRDGGDNMDSKGPALWRGPGLA
jgi:hypothetical protein